MILLLTQLYMSYLHGEVPVVYEGAADFKWLWVRHLRGDQAMSGLVEKDAEEIHSLRTQMHVNRKQLVPRNRWCRRVWSAVFATD